MTGIGCSGFSCVCLFLLLTGGEILLEIVLPKNPPKKQWNLGDRTREVCVFEWRNFPPSIHHPIDSPVQKISKINSAFCSSWKRKQNRLLYETNLLGSKQADGGEEMKEMAKNPTGWDPSYLGNLSGLSVRFHSPCDFTVISDLISFSVDVHLYTDDIQSTPTNSLLVVSLVDWLIDCDYRAFVRTPTVQRVCVWSYWVKSSDRNEGEEEENSSCRRALRKIIVFRRTFVIF